MSTTRDLSDIAPINLDLLKKSDPTTTKPASDTKPIKPATPAQLKKYYAQLRRQYPGKVGTLKVIEAKEFNKMLNKLAFGNKKKK